VQLLLDGIGTLNVRLWVSTLLATGKLQPAMLQPPVGGPLWFVVKSRNWPGQNKPWLMAMQTCQVTVMSNVALPL
jgi:hypothetical protein